MQKIIKEKLSSPLLQKIASDYAAKRIMLVHGRRSFSMCGAETVFSAAFGKGYEIVHYSDFSDNPTWEDAQHGLALCSSFCPDMIFAIGGGSSLDTAKLIRFFYSYSGSFSEKNYKKQKELIPLVAIPTTAGSGAESTRFAVCFENDVKYSVAHDAILADVAVLDWTLTKTNSDYTIACAGFDVLAHAVESYWNARTTEESKELAKKAMQIAFPLLANHTLYKTDRFKMKMSEAANLAGRAINITTTTACHAFSYKITSLLGLPHGHAVAVCFPYFFYYAFSNAEGELKSTMQDLVSILGMTGELKQLLIDYVQKVFSDLYTPRIPTDEEWNIILNSVNKERLANYPLPLTEINKMDFLW